MHKLKTQNSNLKFYCMILFLVYLVNGCANQNETKPSQNSTQSSGYSWDFGKAKEGVILKHGFILKNESTKPLKIKDINTSCGCTATEAKKRDLLPGESTLIQVSFNSKGYSGPNEQFIYVHTDSIDNPVIRFTIKADIEK